MPRARNIKPALFKNEILGTSDPYLSLLFISLWTLADKAGRLEDRPLRIGAETFPYRPELSPLINGYLTELSRLGFIQRYSVNDIDLIQIINFEKHQQPHHTEKASILPCNSLKIEPFTDLTVDSPLNNRESTVPSRSDSLIPDSLIPDSLIPEDSGAIAPEQNQDNTLSTSSDLDLAKAPPNSAAPPQASHPAIAAMREAIGKYPNKALWNDIIDRLGTEPDIVKLKECRVAWIKKGYNANAITWLDWYFNGIPHYNGKPDPRTESYAYVRGQPTQREAIEAEQKMIAEMAKERGIEL